MLPQTFNRDPSLLCCGWHAGPGDPRRLVRCMAGSGGSWRVLSIPNFPTLTLARCCVTGVQDPEDLRRLVRCMADSGLMPTDEAGVHMVPVSPYEFLQTAEYNARAVAFMPKGTLVRTLPWFMNDWAPFLAKPASFLGLWVGSRFLIWHVPGVYSLAVTALHLKMQRSQAYGQVSPLA